MNEHSLHTVLVVEDSTVQRAHLVGLIKQMGFGKVLEASDGIQALHVLDNCGQTMIYLVITDLDMPGMDGLELIRHLTERQITENLIVVSARDPRLLEIVESMGLDDDRVHLLGTLLKPMRLDDLTLLLRQVGKIRRHEVSSSGRSPLHLSQIESALSEAQFIPYFQPKVSMATGLIKGVEALARWQHPEHGILSPLHFIPDVEGTPLMVPFTLSIVDQALAQLTAWRKVGLTSLTVSLNLSADNLADSSFVEKLVALAHEHQISPQSLIWEVTETAIMSNLSSSLSNLGRLELKGFGLAMDDYGIGYSSMQQLARCPFTELKIDRVFVNGASQRKNRRVILESSIDMARRLGVTTVAEGVETQDDWNLLRELGCDVAQGYLAAKPMPGSELVGWITHNRARLKGLVA